MPTPKEYLAIRLWGQDLGSFEYYIKQQQEEASEENAPIDALYKKHEETTWVCVSDLGPDHRFRARYEHALDTAKEKKDAP